MNKSTAYYQANKERLRIADNNRYAKKAKERNDKKNEGLHQLLISKGKKNRTGTIKKCLFCNKEFYCNPSRPDKLCCNANCTKQLFTGKTRICIVCNNEYKCSDSQYVQRNRKTCSIKCRSKLISDIAEKRRLVNPKSVKSIDRCLRYSAKMDQWRNSVFTRDNYTCQHCANRSSKGNAVYLEAHHIKQFATHPELRFEVSNGLTLCKPCHKKVPHIIPKYSK